MTREEIYAQAKQAFGAVPGWLSSAPDGVIQQIWTIFQWNHTDGAISVRDKALVAYGAAAALHCKYCIPFHTAELMLNGVDEAGIKDASWAAETVAGLGTYLHGIGYDLDQFLAELKAAGEYIMSQQK